MRISRNTHKFEILFLCQVENVCMTFEALLNFDIENTARRKLFGEKLKLALIPRKTHMELQHADFLLKSILFPPISSSMLNCGQFVGHNS